MIISIDKYKPALLNGNGSRALISILAILPQKIDTAVDKQSRLNDLAYYLSKEISDIEDTDKKNVLLHSATVSHACCALVSLNILIYSLMSNERLFFFRPILQQIVSK
jgi:hypothetical protein